MKILKSFNKLLINRFIKRLTKSAEQGEADAQYELALLYGYGEGVELDYEKAIQWLQKASEQRHAAAQYVLAMYYLAGEHINQDSEKAIELFRKSAELGDADAQCALASFYNAGEIVEHNTEQAKKWLLKAAEQRKESLEELLYDFYHEENCPLDKAVSRTLEIYGPGIKLFKLNYASDLNSPIIKDLETSNSTTAEQKRLLTFGAILMSYNLHSCRTFKILINKQHAAYLLSEWWDIQSREDTMKIADYLSIAKDHTPFSDDLYKNLVKNDKFFFIHSDLQKYLDKGMLNNAYNSELERIMSDMDLEITIGKNRKDIHKRIAKRIDVALETYLQAFNLLVQLGYTREELNKVSSTAAWDFGRVGFIVRYGAKSGYIEEDEAWTYLQTAAYNASKKYSNWREYIAGYVFGLALGARINSSDLSKTLRYLLDNPRSPFNEVGFS